jgi:hypothetical protein
MIQKFGGILRPAYQFTDRFEDLPQALLKNIQPLSVDWKKETFVASCWIHNFLTSGKTFVLITSQRVVYKDPIRVTQNLFTDMTGVERSKLSENITILSPGNPNKLFPSHARPGDKLATLLFNIINSTWIRTRQAGSAIAAPTSPSTPASPTIMEQIEQLNGLKEKGILTEEEFQQKKKDLLSRL